LKLKTALKTGLDFSLADFQYIARVPNRHDVKPKEDQIKCAIYRALVDSGHRVHIEAAYERSGKKCDVRATRRNNTLWLEIKTGWAGTGGWVNKLREQIAAWQGDIKRLVRVGEPDQKLFVLFLFTQSGAPCAIRAVDAARKVGRSHELILDSGPTKLPVWNGLDEAQYFVWRIRKA